MIRDVEINIFCLIFLRFAYFPHEIGARAALTFMCKNRCSLISLTYAVSSLWLYVQGAICSQVSEIRLANSGC